MIHSIDDDSSSSPAMASISVGLDLLIWVFLFFWVEFLKLLTTFESWIWSHPFIFLMEMMIFPLTFFVLQERLHILEAAPASTKIDSFIPLISDFWIKSVILDLQTELNYVSFHEVNHIYFLFSDVWDA